MDDSPKLQLNSKIPTTENIQIDTLGLNLDFEDPFFPNRKHILRTPKKITAEKPFKSIVQPRKRIVHWPLIVYQGSIKNKSKNEFTAVLIHDNIQKLMKEGDFLDDIQIKSITSDSIVCTRNNEQRIYQRES